ncbi:actin beta/gamma 1 [Strigomonas culicis]|uniref:Actin beta/gamma 1 n=1 Tax=Strigomonas culicis TaxID=28005 RepID=S9UZP8_9TRYP|nr:actin beta/gamma 1 [Strigomonas culicis]|eukprot:EPY34229.1 actin beta/gamma 1 [Strigomonas culicis]
MTSSPIGAAPNGAVLIDGGAHHVRAGFAGEKGPRLDVPALVGRPRHRGIAMAAGMKEYETGEEALVKQGMLSVSAPIHNGEVVRWDDMERYWTQLIFSELQVVPENHSFITTQPVNASARQKERTLELFMETFNAHSLFCGTSQVLSLYAYGLTTGLVVDSGKERTIAVPVHEGYPLGRHAVVSPIAGGALTHHLYQQLRHEGFSLGTEAEQVVLNHAKEELCFVRPSPSVRKAREERRMQHTQRYQHYAAAAAASAGLLLQGSATNSGANPNAAALAAAAAAAAAGQVVDPEDAEEDVAEEYFCLPDGQQVPLRDQKWQTPEVLFDFTQYDPANAARYEPSAKVYTEMGDVYQPAMAKGISWLPFAAIHKCEAALRPQLLRNIVLAGGTMGLRGARQRLEEEVAELYRGNLLSANEGAGVSAIKVHDIPRREYSAWLGGSMLARTSMFPHLVVTRQEYEEEGTHVAHCKFL